MTSLLVVTWMVLAGQAPVAEPSPAEPATPQLLPAAQPPPAPDATPDAVEEIWIRRERELPSRLLIEGLGGVAGIALGSWLPVALVHATCDPTVGTCVPTWFAAMGGVFTLPLGIFAAGRIMKNPGAYGWTLLGTLPGWIVAGITFYFVDRASVGMFNPLAYGTFLLPILPGLLMFEWSGNRNFREEVDERTRAGGGGITFAPVGPRGSLGATVYASF